MQYEDRSTEKLGIAYCDPTGFAARDDNTPLDRESRQQRVRAVLMTYCEPKTHGQTAWEIAGFVLRALDEPEDEAMGVALAARLE